MTMPPEPNKNIEDLLRAYAKRRRDDAGPPAEMPGHTRHLLQAEIARRAARTREPWWRALAGWRPRLAVGALAAAAIVVGVFVLLQTQQRPRHAAELAKAEPLSEKLGAMADRGIAPAEAPPAAAPMPALGQKVDKAVEAAADERKMDKLGVLVAAAKPPATLAAPMPEQVAAVATAAPAKAATDRNVFYFHSDAPVAGGAAGAVVALRFAAEDPAKAAKQQKPPGVLTAFRVEQRGNRVVIVDADGSSYEGQMQLATVETRERLMRRAGRFETDAKGKVAAPAPTPAESETVLGRTLSLDTQPQYSFHAAGTNRSLNQLVVVSGTLSLPTSNAPPARIQGKVKVGEGSEVEINAVSTKP